MGDVVLFVSVSLILPTPLPTELLLIPAMASRVQEKVAPEVLLKALYKKTLPLQIGDGFNELVNTGTGFTRTVTFWVFVHPSAVNE
jgi:hypothetical protein